MPKLELGDYCGTVAYTKLIHTRSVSQSINIPFASTYVEIPNTDSDLENSLGLYIGKQFSIDNNRIVDSRGALEDISLCSDEIFLKAHFADDKQYYAMVLCDGKPLPLSNESYSISFSRNNGTRVLNHKLVLSDEITPGLHVFQAIAIEKNNNPQQIDTAVIVTNRIRINIIDS